MGFFRGLLLQFRITVNFFLLRFTDYYGHIENGHIENPLAGERQRNRERRVIAEEEEEEVCWTDGQPQCHAFETGNGSRAPSASSAVHPTGHGEEGAAKSVLNGCVI